MREFVMFKVEELPSAAVDFQFICCQQMGGCDGRRFQLTTPTSPSGLNKVIICGIHAQLYRDNLDSALKDLDS